MSNKERLNLLTNAEVSDLYSQPGYRYKNAGVMLLDLTPQATMQLDFFNQENSTRRLLMQTFDRINKTFGKNTVFHAAQGIHRHWQMKSDRRQPEGDQTSAGCLYEAQI